MRKGYETFLTLIFDSKRGQVDLEKIPVDQMYSLKSYNAFPLRRRWTYP